MTWQFHEEADISWWHCERPGHWFDGEVFCSKCQEMLIEIGGKRNETNNDDRVFDG